MGPVTDLRTSPLLPSPTSPPVLGLGPGPLVPSPMEDGWVTGTQGLVFVVGVVEGTPSQLVS